MRAHTTTLQVTCSCPYARTDSHVLALALGQVLRTMGGRFLNISDDTIQKEELERQKLEEWIEVLGDAGSNVVSRVSSWHFLT